MPPTITPKNSAHRNFGPEFLPGKFAPPEEGLVY
jgi:hypothetical protein